jgi:hypothetical protein
MKLGEKENALDALWTNNNVTSGPKDPNYDLK